MRMMVVLSMAVLAGAPALADGGRGGERRVSRCCVELGIPEVPPGALCVQVHGRHRLRPRPLPLLLVPAEHEGPELGPALRDEKPVPASLSTRVVQGFLRKKLGYKGLTITDDLTMGAVTSLGLTPELFLRAFEAGNDLLLFSQTTPLVEQAFKTIVKAARSSATLRRRVDESVERILALKSRMEFVPLRYRTHLKPRITRQIDKLRKSLEPVKAFAARTF